MTPPEKPPLRPCECSKCRHCWAAAMVCTRRLLSRAPGEKRSGCLYYEEREKRGRGA